MGAPGSVLGSAQLREFAKKYSYRLSGALASHKHDALPPSSRGTAQDDPLYSVVEWSRARRIALEEGHRRCPQRVPLSRLQRFADDLRRFKDDNSLFDYTDMLEFIVSTEQCAEVDVAFVDEAQDLSPLQITAVELLFRRCQRVHIAGDDDQALYGWAGADPSWMLSLKKRATNFEVLPQSYRVPPKVQAVAERIIHINKNRVPKTYAPRKNSTGKVSRMRQDQVLTFLLQNTGNSYILARNSMHLRPWARELMRLGIPYLQEGDNDLMRNSYTAARTAALLCNHKPVCLEDLQTMLEFVPSRSGDLLPRGVKSKLDDLLGGADPMAITRYVLEGIGLDQFLGTLDSQGLFDVLTRLPGAHRRQLENIIRRHGTNHLTPRITLSTIHRAKGGERDTVVIIPDMSRASFEELTQRGQAGREAEHRVAYVAVTRAREHLIVVWPKGQKYFPYERYFGGTAAG